MIWLDCRVIRILFCKLLLKVRNYSHIRLHGGRLLGRLLPHQALGHVTIIAMARLLFMSGKLVSFQALFSPSFRSEIVSFLLRYSLLCCRKWYMNVAFRNITFNMLKMPGEQTPIWGEFRVYTATECVKIYRGGAPKEQMAKSLVLTFILPLGSASCSSKVSKTGKYRIFSSISCEYFLNSFTRQKI